MLSDDEEAVMTVFSNLNETPATRIGVQKLQMNWWDITRGSNVAFGAAVQGLVDKGLLQAAADQGAYGLTDAGFAHIQSR